MGNKFKLKNYLISLKKNERNEKEKGFTQWIIFIISLAEIYWLKHWDINLIHEISQHNIIIPRILSLVYDKY